MDKPLSPLCTEPSRWSVCFYVQAFQIRRLLNTLNSYNSVVHQSGYPLVIRITKAQEDSNIALRVDPKTSTSSSSACSKRQGNLLVLVPYFFSGNDKLQLLDVSFLYDFSN